MLKKLVFSALLLGTVSMVSVQAEEFLPNCSARFGDCTLTPLYDVGGDYAGCLLEASDGGTGSSSFFSAPSETSVEKCSPSFFAPYDPINEPVYPNPNPPFTGGDDAYFP